MLSLIEFMKDPLSPFIVIAIAIAIGLVIRFTISGKKDNKNP